ncbi:MAG TPA: hypothetical protein VFZ96_00335 [Actinomycetota bacterium]|nr:hypothetical protein [Actinomycetota bacterium]
MGEGMMSSDADVAAVLDDAMGCAAEVHALGERIDAFRRRGGAAIGGEPGPEVPTLRDRQTELVERFLERAAGGDQGTLDAARRRLRGMYAERHDLVTGRALTLVEAALDRSRR